MDTNTLIEWRSVVDYDGYYEISEYGDLRSIDRYQDNGRFRKGQVIKTFTDKTGYLKVRLSRKNVQSTRFIHQMVAESFLGHRRSGHKLVVNHIDNKPLNNHYSNLDIRTQRNNVRTHSKGSSEYRWVCWIKDNKKWRASLVINGKLKHLGLFDDDYEAHLCAKKVAIENNLI